MAKYPLDLSPHDQCVSGFGENAEREFVDQIVENATVPSFICSEHIVSQEFHLSSLCPQSCRNCQAVLKTS
jgi:hypothetical protein